MNLAMLPFHLVYGDQKMKASCHQPFCPLTPIYFPLKGTTTPMDTMEKWLCGKCGEF